jgi:apolipoprotein D and lipocalin family protein
VATKVEYSIRPDGKVKVVNMCREGAVDGKLKSIEGKAWSVDPATNAKLKVQFFWPFSGDYWIIQLDPEYRYAVVGHPKRAYLWILSRTPGMDDATYGAITARLIEQGYDPARILRTPQR